MPKVIVIGKHANILPFKAVGVEPVDIEDVDGARQALRSVRESGEETLALIPENIAVDCQNEIRLLRQGIWAKSNNSPACDGL